MVRIGATKRRRRRVWSYCHGAGKLNAAAGIAGRASGLWGGRLLPSFRCHERVGEGLVAPALLSFLCAPSSSPCPSPALPGERYRRALPGSWSVERGGGAGSCPPAAIALRWVRAGLEVSAQESRQRPLLSPQLPSGPWKDLGFEKTVEGRQTGRCGRIGKRLGRERQGLRWRRGSSISLLKSSRTVSCSGRKKSESMVYILEMQKPCSRKL